MVIIYGLNIWEEFSVVIYDTDSKTAAVNGNIVHCLQGGCAAYMTFTRAKKILLTEIPVLILLLTHTLPFGHYAFIKEKKKNRYVS